MDSNTPPEPVARKRWRWVLPLILVIVWLVLGGAAGPFSGKLAEVQKNDNLSFLPATAESTEVAQLQERFSTDTTIPAVIVYEFPAQAGPAALGAVAAQTEQLAEIEGVEGKVIGPIPAQDGQAVSVVVPVQTTGSEEAVATAVEEIRKVVDESPVPGATIYVTGPAGFLADLGEAFAGIDGLLLLVTLLVVLIILLIVYRSPVLPVIVLFSSLMALGLASAVVYVLADNEVLTLNGQSQGILFILVIGAATDYALLLTARYREELRRNVSKYDAMRATLKGTWEPIVASGGTVIIGLMMLLLSDLNSNRGLGPVAAVGIFFSMLAGLTFLPAVLTLFGRGVFWPFRPRFASESHEATGMWSRIAAWVGRKQRPVWIGSLLVLVALAAFAPTFKAQGLPTSEFFLTTVESTEGQEALQRHFPGGSGSETIVITGADDTERVIEVVQANPGVASAQAVPPQVDGLALVQVTLNDVADSEAAELTVQDLRTELDVVSTSVLVGGPSAQQLDTVTTAKRDLRVIIPAVLLVIFLILMVLLRSVVAAALLVAANVISFAATLGLGALVFNHILGFPGADPSVPLFAFVFLVALGIDYSIFLMTRAREETRNSGHRAGMLKALAVTGGVITSAGIVLAATFSALGVLPLLFLFQLAFLVATGVLIDTFIVRSLLVPGLALDIGPKTWWPSALSRPEPSETEPEAPPVQASST